MAVAPLLLSPGWAQSSSPANAYRLGIRDLVQVKVFEAPDLDSERRIRADGTIQLPVLGDIPAAGLTEAELAAHIEAALEESYLQRASVSVEITEIRSRPIRVVGAVTNPGDLTLTGSANLLEVLTEAGGLGQQGGLITVHRRAESGLTTRLEIAMDDLLAGDPRLWNIPIFPDDLINVSAATPTTVYVLGELGSRGALEFPHGAQVTLLAVIARSGGLGERASKKIVVKRQGPDGTLEEIEASYKRILAGKDPDLELRHGDVVLVRKSAF